MPPIVVKSACPFRIVCKAVTCEKIKDVVLLVRQLQHGFTKNAKVSPNLTVTHIEIIPNLGWSDISETHEEIIDETNQCRPQTSLTFISLKSTTK